MFSQMLLEMVYIFTLSITLRE